MGGRQERKNTEGNKGTRHDLYHTIAGNAVMKCWFSTKQLT